jgi:hypothetical protein
MIVVHKTQLSFNYWTYCFFFIACRVYQQTPGSSSDSCFCNQWYLAWDVQNETCTKPSLFLVTCLPGHAQKSSRLPSVSLAKNVFYFHNVWFNFILHGILHRRQSLVTWCLIFSDSKKTEHLERFNLCLLLNWSNHRIVALLRCCTFSCTCTHTSCYAAVRSHALAHIRHATRLYVLMHLHTYVLAHIRHATLVYVLMHWHTYVMLCRCRFACTSTRTSCYLLYVLMHLHTYVMLRCCTFSCTCRSKGGC